MIVFCMLILHIQVNFRVVTPPFILNVVYNFTRDFHYAGANFHFIYFVLKPVTAVPN